MGRKASIGLWDWIRIADSLHGNHGHVGRDQLWGKANWVDLENLRRTQMGWLSTCQRLRTVHWEREKEG